jgi:hypothetical protein
LPTLITLIFIRLYLGVMMGGAGFPSVRGRGLAGKTVAAPPAG